MNVIWYYKNAFLSESSLVSQSLVLGLLPVLAGEREGQDAFPSFLDGRAETTGALTLSKLYNWQVARGILLAQSFLLAPSKYYILEKLDFGPHFPPPFNSSACEGSWLLWCARVSLLRSSLAHETLQGEPCERIPAQE